PDRQRKALRASRTRKDAEIDLRLPEGRRLRRDDQVARHRELATPAEAVAGHRSDERRSQATDDVPLVDAAPALVQRDRGSRRELCDVGTGCEGALVTTEHDAADLRVGVELLQARY